MHDFSNHLLLKRIILSCCASSIAFSPLAYASQDLPIVHEKFIDAALVIRLGKLADKIKKNAKKLDLKKSLEILFDIKNEVEGYTGMKINVDRQVDVIKQEFVNQGIFLPKDYWKSITTLINKKKKSRYEYMEFASEHVYDDDFQESLEEFIAKAKDEQQEVPVTIVVGVTMALCGLFLFFIPIPTCQWVGGALMAEGSRMTGAYLVQYLSDQRKKELYNENEVFYVL